MESTVKPWLTQNWNTFASSLLVHGLAQLGVRGFFVSPGYRDAPFIAALQACPDLYIKSCMDERAGAYEALGFAKATRRPAVLVCTSGTAGANYLPALIEAKTDQIPLFVLTADRPFEMVYAGAQQVIDQRQLFGPFVKQSLDFPAPGPTMDLAAWLSYARMLVEISCEGRQGPVHLNLPFRLPLDPVETADRPTAADLTAAQDLVQRLKVQPPLTQSLRLTTAVARDWVEDLRSAERGLIILGRIQGRDEQRAAASLAASLGWPCFADITSGVKGRLDHELMDPTHPIMSEALTEYRPDVCIYLGRRAVTGFFDNFLQKVKPRAYWVFTPDATVQDPGHVPERRQVMIDLVSLAQLWPDTPFVPRPAHEALWNASERVRTQLARPLYRGFCFADVAQEIAAAVPTRDHGLFLGNSTAIRAFDSWCDLTGKRLPIVEANRGVNGIEGLVATTLGLAAGAEHAWTAVIGDVSALHDLNSILSLPQTAAPIILILVNNSGGRIFEFLPIKAHGWVKDPLITTPHHFRFQGVAEMAGLAYEHCSDRLRFRDLYQKALRSGTSCLIECQQDPLADQMYVQAYKKQE
ncbi:2-succinyl-5-enolpyruvyl-6-hydroxy-3-cyclohexene-1-carboxylic-acid synthase [Oligoflexus tunisiensis]|uniref:2-succinyl-5-enolpyruvyl-6-hydroxy-3- cyclohexene-1-carboxylic-acid synthase n=1 Tax=Oligoflexus tunisiensis TaxID=708132 RepID=UPI000AC96BF4|nr:2-succinyl-5-enolpyruvyl-6-hydroxy-3-cyclohexene-1-carboxylic-acid synthase [Oligoflexus tunisiensis]